MIVLPSHAKLTHGSLDAQCIFIRGLPGSGKSTLAQQYAALGYIHLEADMYFIQPDGTYVYDASRIKDAHTWCKRAMVSELQYNRRIVVSNTFTTTWELESYRSAAVCYTRSIGVIVCRGTWDNIHNVPQHILERMKSRWEG